MSHPYVDTEKGLTMLGGNKALYHRLLKTYMSSSMYSDAVSAVESGDAAQSQVALHTLKGATANLHLEAIYEKSKELELGIKESGVMPTPEAMEELAHIQNCTLAEIASLVS